MFPCEFCKIFENTYFVEHLRMAASGRSYLYEYIYHIEILVTLYLVFIKQAEKMRISLWSF